MALLEAAATGMPMISTNVGAIPELVRDGETGFLIDPRDLGGFVECLQSLVHDAGLRRRMGRAAREDAETLFDSRRNGQRVVELLLETAGAQTDAKWMDR
jgi:glycosyltransferase involved in cell wall biosynthesis